ncbi:cytochrome P450 [Auriculariales sp. MPI-PUGE-AT-0066]|nr:cytochrome P450 [Auriculariales sp. MPI-PUGE-AT-0066]
MLSWSDAFTFATYSLAVPLAGVATGTVVLAGWLSYLKVVSLSDTLKKLPGNHLGSFQQADVDTEEWAREHANGRRDRTPLNLRLPGLYPFEGRLRLLTLDPRIIAYILNSSNFEKPAESRAFLTKLLGKGMFAAEGREHKAMRKAFAPAFAKSVLRVIEPVMLQKAEQVRSSCVSRLPPTICCWQLCDIWSREAKDGAVDVQSWLHRASLDVMTALGFGEDVNAVADKQDSIYAAYRSMLRLIEYGTNAFNLYLSLKISWFHTVFPDVLSRTFDAAHHSILTSGRSLLHLDASPKLFEKDEEVSTPSLLHAIIRDSMRTNKTADAQLFGVLSTLLFNGADSVGSTTAWALHHLSLNQNYQHRLRAELAEIRNDTDRVKVLESLPLLSNLIRETLRLSPPLAATIRVACRDEVLHAGEDIVLSDGSLVREIFVKKGTLVHIPIEPVNTLTDFWGADAKVFNPDRWNNLPETAKALPGIHQTMAFLFGPHSCPGSNIALAEMRIFIAAIVQHFELHVAADIGRMNALMLRPYVRTKWLAEGVQLPLALIPISA